MIEEKSLDRKLAAIHADPFGSDAFILADAKDADMAFGVAAPGRRVVDPETGEARLRTLDEFRQQIRAIVDQGLVDVMLMSAHTSHHLTIDERIFDRSTVTPAVRGNDSSDIHLARGGRSASGPSRPFRSSSLGHVTHGRVDPPPGEPRTGADLVLYSVTFNNDPELDLATLEAFKAFREEAERRQVRYFLEVFDPNVPGAVAPEDLAGFTNDMIARMLAGVAPPGRPTFLKLVYHGPAAMEELVHYDPHLVVGILGGSSGTTMDAFHLLDDARRHGARVALFGRKINHAEDQLTFIRFLRLLADGDILPSEAVKAYHGELGKLGIRPHRSLLDDLRLQVSSGSYAAGK